MKIQFLSNISVLAFLSQNIQSNAFTLPSIPLRTISSYDRMERSPLFAKVEILDEKLANDEGNVKKRKRVKLERDWTFKRDNGEEYKASGKMNLKVFYPNEPTIKGCAFFMHGFSQYPKAYRKTLQEAADKANVVIVASETGIFSPFVLSGIFSHLDKVIKDRTFTQFFLQMALSEDTKQTIRMILENDKSFTDIGLNSRLPMAVCGHSMGGGLSFPVAAGFQKINYVFTMAPAFGVDDFDPIKKGVDVRTVKNSVLLAGNWDLIAKATKVESISDASNAKAPKSSVYVGIDKGLHTGFEDKLVIGNLSLLNVWALIFGPVGAFERVIYVLLNIIRTNTGQLEGTNLLLEHFLIEMTKGKKVTVESADKYLEENIKSQWDKNFHIKY